MINKVQGWYLLRAYEESNTFLCYLYRLAHLSIKLPPEVSITIIST